MTQTEVHQGKTRDRALIQSALATVLSRLVSAGAMVVSLAIAAHSLTKPELGVVAVLTLLSAFLSFGDFGLGTLLMTRLPEARAKNNTLEMRKAIGVTLSTLIITGSLIAVVGAASAFVLPWQSLLGAERLPVHEVRDAVVCLFVAGGLAIPATIGSRILAAMLRASVAQLWLIASSVLSLMLTAACSHYNLPIWAYVFAIVGAPSVVSIVQTTWVLYRSFPNLRPHRYSVPPRSRWKFLKASSLFAVLSLSAVISYGIDSIVISSIRGASTAAVFAIAARLFTLVGVTVGLAGQQMWSALTDAIVRGDSAWARSRFKSTLLISIGITTFASAVFVVFGRWLSRIWVGSHLVPPLSLLIVLGIYTVYSTATVQASYLLAAVERVRTIAAVGVIAALVNVVASIVLTRIYGISGPILGSIVALALVMTVPLFVLCRQEIKKLGKSPSPALESPVA